MTERRELKISVRNLVEFIFREGDINSTGLGTRNPEAMQLGNKIHKKIQKSMGIGYQAEVPLFTYVAMQSEETGEEFDLKIEGRADGIFRDDSEILVDEIKGVFMDIHQLKEPLLVHKAQAMCYAYMICETENPAFITVQVTYCHLESEEIRRFPVTYRSEEIRAWFRNLVDLYTPWARYEFDWQKSEMLRFSHLPSLFHTATVRKNLPPAYIKRSSTKRKFLSRLPPVSERPFPPYFRR